MTRDEAMARMPNEIRCNDAMSDGQLIDRLVALGMLKLDEPRSAFEELCSRLAGDFGWSHSTGKMKEIALALESASLRIVEK